MARTDKPADVFQYEVEVVFDDWEDKWVVKLRVRPRTRHTMGPPYFYKPNAVRFARRLARDLNIPVRVLEEK